MLARAEQRLVQELVESETDHRVLGLVVDLARCVRHCGALGAGVDRLDNVEAGLVNQSSLSLTYIITDQRSLHSLQTTALRLVLVGVVERHEVVLAHAHAATEEVTGRLALLERELAGVDDAESAVARKLRALRKPAGAVGAVRDVVGLLRCHG